MQLTTRNQLTVGKCSNDTLANGGRIIPLALRNSTRLIAELIA